MNTADPTFPGQPFPSRLRQSQGQLAEWPEPDDVAQQHSLQLVETLREQIDAGGGRITFHDYMQTVLYAPGLGYYAAGSHKFGAGGDFITAPELSPLFAECVADSLEPVLQAGHRNVLEVGAGSGILAARLLLRWQDRGCLPNHYYILELSGDLRQRQREQIEQQCPELLARVEWLEQWPDKFSGVVLANELIDAMPVHRVSKQQGRWYEQMVGYEQEQFIIDDVPLDNPALSEQLALIEQEQLLPDGYLTEINLHAGQWIDTLGSHLQRGIVLLFDYGYSRHEYYHPQRNQGTLMCHYRHRAHDDPFVYPGLQDITAHVDFTSLADQALDAGFNVAGYTTQAHFLLDNGILQRLEQLQTADEAVYQQRVAEVRRLTLPQEMGESFKVMLLSKDSPDLPAGFGSRDLRHQL